MRKSKRGKMDEEKTDETPMDVWLDTMDHSLKNCRKKCSHCRYHERNEEVIKVETVLIAITCAFSIANFVWLISSG